MSILLLAMMLPFVAIAILFKIFSTELVNAWILRYHHLDSL